MTDLALLAEAAFEHLRSTYMIWDGYNDRAELPFREQDPKVQEGLIRALSDSVASQAQELGWDK